MEPKDLSLPPTAAAHETAQLLNLLERSQRLLENCDQHAQPHQKRTLLSLRLARNEAITQVLRMSTLISAMTCTQEKLTRATRKLADGLRPLEPNESGSRR